MTCDRCGTTEDNVGPGTLFSFYHIAICNKCINSWHRLTREDSRCRERENLVARLEIMRKCAQGGIGNLSLVDGYVQFVDELQRLELVLMTTIETWIQSYESNPD